jgi:hypothetical protein
LKCFHTFLRDRQANLVDSDLAITKLSGELQDKIESWIRQGSRYRELDLRGPDKPPLGTAYVLSCPQMHVVPEFELLTVVKNTRPVCYVLIRLRKLDSLPSSLKFYSLLTFGSSRNNRTKQKHKI